jgi:nitroimidazol reductase NimA-like FMN-containing flavoprotein (pyridoxamine 5'-phosphate oxidase superfamily)/GNAT superfamily N-acetyltransferase
MNDPGDRTLGLALLARAPLVHLASTRPDGAPLLRPIQCLLDGETLVFHGRLTGEKVSALGRRAVVSAVEVVADLPSWFFGDLACPADTLFESVLAEGTLERVEAPPEKARLLAAFTAKYQPEGRHEPIDAAAPRYVPELRGTLVFRMPIDRLSVKRKLLQQKSRELRTALLGKLWERGAPGDAAAIERLRAADPSLPPPAFLRGPEGTTLHVALGEGDLAAAAALLGQPLEAVARRHRRSHAWVGARSGGALVATARAVSDGDETWVRDLAVAPAWCGRGLGRALGALLRDHPAVRGAARPRSPPAP